MALSAPASVRRAFRQGLALYAAGRGGAGLRPETVAWARRLADGEPITLAKARKMRAWFARHGAAVAESARRQRDPQSPAAVAWLLWGGDPSIAYRREGWRDPVAPWLDGALASMERRANPEYWMSHRPSQNGPPLHNLASVDVESPMPADVLKHPEWYTGFSEILREFWPLILSAQGRPGARVTIYRAMRAGIPTINRGDWVTPSKFYAMMDLDSDPVGREVVSATVLASTVIFAGDDLVEWGYWGPDVEAKPLTKRRSTRRANPSKKWLAALPLLFILPLVPP